MADEMMQVTPEDYYREKSPRKRGQILESLLAQDPGEENQIRKAVYDLRYDVKNWRPDGDYADRYMALWMNIRMVAAHGGGLFGYGRDRKALNKSLDQLGIRKYGSMGEVGEQVMYRELFHMSALYLNASLSDKSYTSALMGMMALKEEQIQDKITKDVFQVAYQVPKLVNMIGDFAIFTRGAHDAFVKLRPDCEEALNKMIASL